MHGAICDTGPHAARPCPAKFIIFDQHFLVFNTTILVFNTKFIIFTHPQPLT